LILGRWNGLFYLLPIEGLIKDRQERYYRVLEECDRNASSTVFIDFMLDVFWAALLSIAGDEALARVRGFVSEKD
jgi:hypothetical protein